MADAQLKGFIKDGCILKIEGKKVVVGKDVKTVAIFGERGYNNLEGYPISKITRQR